MARQLIKYRVCLFKINTGSFFYTFTIHNLKRQVGCESHPDFVRWLTDWVEVEVSD